MNSDDELAQRGRAIFDRLRETTEVSGGQGSGAEDEAVGVSIPTPDTVEDVVAAAGSGEAEAPPTDDPDARPAGLPDASGEDAEADDDPLAVEPTTAVAELPGEVPPQPVGAMEDAGVDDAAVAVAAAGADIADAVAVGEGLEPPVVEAPSAVRGEHESVLTVAEGVPGRVEPSPVVIEDGEVPQLAADVAPLPASFVRPLPRVMAIANQKGGVGKTTTAVNLSAALAELGYRVLVIDLDPQGNATTGLGVNPRNLESSVYDVLMHDVALEDCIEPTSLRNLFVVPATIDLAGAEIELVPSFSRELKLRKALEAVIEDFDFVLIDCPPSLGLITVNGLAAASEVVVPIQCEYYALEGLGQLLRNVNLVQGNLNPRLEVSAIILTMYDARTKLADQVATEVRKHFGTKVCRNIVPRTVRLSEAPSFGQPIIVFDPSSRGAIAYRELAKEVSGGAPQRVG